MKSHPRSASFCWLALIGLCLAFAAFALRSGREAKAVRAVSALALVNAASYDNTVAPGSIAALFAANLTNQAPQAAQTLPLPTTLAGLSVKINGTLAPLFFASTNQINLQVPSGVNPGSATVEVFASGTSAPITTGMATVAEAAPGVFTIEQSGLGQAVALNSDYSINADLDRLPGSRPEATGNFVVVYATGIGRTNPLVADGQPAPAGTPALATAPTTVTIGGAQAQALFSGLAPGFVGLWQLNVVLPASLPTNLTTSLRVELKGRQSQATTLAVANRNEFGSIAGIVVDAVNGAPIGGASLTLQPTGSERARNVSTNANGQYGFYVINPGAYNLSASAAGYIAATQSASITGGQSRLAPPIALSPPLDAGQYRVVVAWQSGPDLDAHLTGPASGGNRFHVWWNEETALSAPPTARLDRDDLSGAGPETISFTPRSSGVYRFSVQNYTDRDAESNTRLAQAGALVRVYSGNQQIALIAGPAGGGTFWKVFELSDGQLNVVNQLSDEPTPSNIKISF
jgi:uncharacterized protein (TIGR03437 family)